MISLVFASCGTNSGMQTNNTTQNENTDMQLNNQQSENSILQNIIFPDKEKTKVSGFAEFNSEVFSKNIPELFEKSTDVILGTVIKDDELYVSETSDLEVAYSDISIKTVWKGNLKVSDCITVSETGRRYDDGHSYSIGGEPILKLGNYVILFLFSNNQNERYGISGCFQGKFFIDNENIVHSYEYFSDEYKDQYFEDIGATISLEEFESILDSLK